MQKKRDRLHVIYDILRTIQEKNGNIRPTHILYKSNLSHKMMAEYLAELIQKGFIVESETKNGKTYSLTDKGYDYLAKFRLIIEFQKSFGLD